MKIKIGFIVFIFLVAFILPNFFTSYSLITEVEPNMILQDLSYIESTKKLNNPERGFYRTGIAWLTDTGADHTGYATNPVVHLRVSLSNFSNAYGEKDIPEVAVDGLKKIIDGYKSRNSQVILRFSYADYANKEPSINQVLEHVKQLSSIFYDYDDVIMSIDTGLLGPWGEQHSSSIVSQENINKLINVFLENTPDDMQINVRRPSYFAGWAGITYDDLHKTFDYENQDAYRVGVYNDGYLGSHSDLGTFIQHPTLGWRENENLWLEKHATHTFYGGEVVANAFPDAFAYNSADYISEEMFRTHTTYLNYEWNQSVIFSWKNEIYNGPDLIYQGLDAFTYIENHLGYRYVLRASYINDYIYYNDENTLNIKGLIENVGAGNLINAKKVEIILEGEEETYIHEIDYDFRKILSNEISEYEYEINLNKTLKEGKYKVYLKISSDDENSLGKYTIEFANENQYNDILQANYLGTTTVTKKESYEINKTINLDQAQINLLTNRTFVGDVIKFEVSNIEGYEIKSVKVIYNNNEVQCVYENGEYIFVMPNNNVEIKVELEKIAEKENLNSKPEVNVEENNQEEKAEEEDNSVNFEENTSLNSTESKNSESEEERTNNTMLYVILILVAINIIIVALYLLSNNIIKLKK